jgi:hypothetical protein
MTRVIRDDSYNHVLRIYHDRYSKAVRLLASVSDGNMKQYALLLSLKL